MFRRRTAAAVLLFGATSLGLLSACGSSSPRLSDTTSAEATIAGGSSAPATATPSGSGSPTAAPAVTTPTPVNNGTIIDTPPEILAGVSTTVPGSKVLTDDYTPARSDISTVLQAVVPEVTIFDG